MLSLPEYDWLCSPEGLTAWRSVVGIPFPPTLHAIRTATRTDPIRVALLAEQLSFAHGKARAKVDAPIRWFWTKKLLEQASDVWTADETAADAPQALPRWLDICSGAGVDCIALAKRRPNVAGLDADPVAIRLLQANARMNQVDVEACECRAESLDIQPDMYLHIDPDRRAEGQRSIDPEHAQPSWEWIASAIDRCGAVSLKLAPGLRVPMDFDWRGAPQPHAIRWVSWEGSVRQQRWYWHIDRWPDGARIASSGRTSSLWHHEIFLASEIDAPADDNAGRRRLGGRAVTIDDACRLSSGYVADQDPVVRAACLGDALAARLNIACIGDRNGYYFSDHVVFHPMLRWFRILDSISMDSKKIRALARRLNPREWELKSRGVEIDLVELHRQLSVDPTSERRLTFLFTRIGKKHCAIVGERIDQEAT